MAKKQSQEDNSDHQEGLRESARKLDLGSGIEVTMGLRQADGSVEVSYHFSNKLKGLKKTTTTTLGNLEVEFSSTQAEDNDLLHFLTQKAY